jgi:hypothetical protein
MQDRAFRAEDRAAYLASQLLMHRQGVSGRALSCVLPCIGVTIPCLVSPV